MPRLPPLTEEQKQQALDALDRTVSPEFPNGNKAAAARSLGLHENTYVSRLQRAQEAQTRDKSVADLTSLIPEGQELRGVSNLYRTDPVTGEKELRLQWVKTKQDLDRQLEIIREVADALSLELPKEISIPSPAAGIKTLLSTYIVTDYHIGQMAWGAETMDEDWDTDKACEFLVKWFGMAIKAAPASHTAILAQLGDFLHYDGIDAVTPTSKHLLDTDARFARIVPAAVMALRIIIKMLLEKHQHVIILMAEGNHDMASSIWLRVLMTHVYENEPRVTVDQTPHPYYGFGWGKTAIFFHHGHKKKVREISKTFVSMYRKIWSDCEYAYAHMGHMHHVESKEDSLMLVEQHSTIAAKDAYAARGGYLSNRGASVITYSKDFGEVHRATIRPEMVR